jgi:hypothetical protein
MAGGLFPGRPFAFNIKCVIFTALLAGGYWLLPHKNKWVLFFLLWFPYIAMAWYDYTYDCRDKLQPTVVPFGRFIWLPFKPPGYKEEFDTLPQSHINLMNRVDHVVGWTIVVVLVGLYSFNKLPRKFLTN